MKPHLALITVALLGAACSGNSSGSQTGDAVSETGSDSTTAAAAAILPGQGLKWGDATVSFSDPVSTLQEVLGVPTLSHDLGDGLGLLSWPQQGIAALADSDSKLQAFYLTAQFGGSTPSGLSIGVTRADADAALGSGEVEPFTGAVCYSQKLCIHFVDEKVDSIHLLGASD